MNAILQMLSVNPLRQSNFPASHLAIICLNLPQIRLACGNCPEFGTTPVIPKVGLSRILQKKPVTKAFLKEIFGITF